MSSAFRNFILTLVLMLVVLGFAAWKLIPKLEDAVLKPIFNETSDGAETSDSEASANISDISAGETEVSNPTVPVEDTVFDCLFITKNDANDVCSVEEDGVFYCFRSAFPAVQMPARISTTDRPMRIPEKKSCTSVPPVVLDRALLAMPRTMRTKPQRTPF